MMRKLFSLVLLGAVAACADSPTAPEALDADPSVVSEDRFGGFAFRVGQKAQAFVVHGINGTDLGLDEALPVDVSLNGACAIEDFRFRDITDAIPLDAGTYDIRVHLNGGTACAGPAAIEVLGAELNRRDNVTIVAHLAEGGAPTASIFANDLGRSVFRPRVVARHTADFGAVDILVNGGVAFGNVTNGQQGAATLRPGHYTIGINAAGTDINAFEADLRLRPFRYYAFFAVGSVANGTFEVLVQDLNRREIRFGAFLFGRR